MSISRHRCLSAWGPSRHAPSFGAPVTTRWRRANGHPQFFTDARNVPHHARGRPFPRCRRHRPVVIHDLDHMAHVQKLFKDYPAGDVVMYDENVRFLNDKFQRSSWGINNTQMQQDIHGPAAKRANLAKETATALAASAAAAAAAGSPPWAPRKDSDRQVQASVRPFMKFQAHEGKNICMRWNWSIGDCTDDNCYTPRPTFLLVLGKVFSGC
eukprot:COSAG03_NODE_564_length_6921_cov_98.751686_2_plen_212_part_00